MEACVFSILLHLLRVLAVRVWFLHDIEYVLLFDHDGCLGQISISMMMMHWP